MNKQIVELKQLTSSMFITKIMPNTEEDISTKDVDMLQTRASGTCPETTNQSVQYPMEDSGSTSGVQSVVQQESWQPEVQSKRYRVREIVARGDKIYISLTNIY
ncbi:unnamed protein product [Callosobruchus maculatus]|uniref:Uncharacterized protein n=1 Tax=Callosobruchus maculatus TaxID=64391 RepID=A0A653DVL7_CALMS|nr:unnamed protein product [Callosobruchus maculatus]